MAYGFIKLSVLFFYRRLFVNGTSTRFDIASKVAIGITSIWTIAFFLTQLFSCGRHVDWNWGPLINQTRCLSGLAYTDALYVSDFITDLLVICLPIPIVSSPSWYDTKNLVRWPFKDSTTSYDDAAKNWNHRRPVTRHYVRCHKINIHPPPVLTNCRSIVASVVRIVYGFQIQADGLSEPTDVDGTFPSSLSFHKSQPTNTAHSLRSTNNAPLLGNARSRYLPHRHQPSLSTFPRHETLPAFLRRQHPQCFLAEPITIAPFE